MRITVKCFAGCKDAVGAASLALDLPEHTTAGGALEALITAYPAMSRYRRSLMLAVNTEYVSRDTPLQDGDELACIPPVSGGNGKDRLVQAWIEIHREELMADWQLAVHGEEVFKIEPLR